MVINHSGQKTMNNLFINKLKHQKIKIVKYLFIKKNE